MKPDFIRKLVSGKPADFQGTHAEYKALVHSLLDPPDHKRPWVRVKVKTQKDFKEIWHRENLN